MLRIEDIDSNFKLPELDEPDIEWINARDERFTLLGIYFDEALGRYMRMPQDVASQVNQGVFNLCKHTSGGRLRFITDSPYVAVKAVVPSHSIMKNMCPIGTTGFAVYIDGTYRGSIVPDQVEMMSTSQPRSGIQGIHKFGNTNEKNAEIYFPLYNGVFEMYVGIKKGSTLAPLPIYDSRRVVFYGSSITQGGCATRPGNDYAAILCRKLGVDYVNMGFSGNAKGEPSMAEYLADMHFDVYVIDYDHNAPTVEHLEQTHYPFYQTIRAKNPDTPIIFISKPDFKGTANDITRRDLIRANYERALAAGDKAIYFIDGETLFGDEDSDACTLDGCHPNDLGFYRMATVVSPVVAKALNR